MMKKRFSPDRLYVPLWIAVGTLIAWNRSFWGDEFGRYLQSKMSLADNIRSVMGEPAPVAPGEAVLNALSRFLFEPWLPAEVWGRLPGILWGALTIALLVRMGRRLQLRWLPFLGFFSVGFVTLSALMRGYPSLIFAGTYSLDLITRSDGQDPKTDRFDRFALPLAILFAHIYGICFLGMAAFLERRFKSTALAAIYVLGILSRSSLGFAHSTYDTADWLGLARNTLAICTNPHKVMPLGLLLIVLGFLRFKRTQKPSVVAKVALLSVCALVLPTLATLHSGYFFAHRQLAGGMAVGWLFMALGCRDLEDRIARRRPKWHRAVALAPVVVGVVPWALAVIGRRPPYPDQPFHRYRQIAVEASRSRQLWLFTDYWDGDTFRYYLQRTQSGFTPASIPPGERRYREVTRLCNPAGSCVDFLSNLGRSPFPTVEQLGPYERIIYREERPPATLAGQRTQRSW